MLYKSPKRIKLENFINSKINLLVNNPISNKIKELFSIGMGYPEYLYSDSTKEYINKFEKKSIGKGLTEVEVTIVDNRNYAMDYSKHNYFIKNFILNDVNRFFGKEKIFRYKRIITYK